MSEVVLLYSALGLLGGLARALLGMSKAITRGERIKPGVFVVTLIVAGIIGALLGAFSSNVDYHISLIAGYAGTDVLESIAKAAYSKSITFRQ